jgi:tRNA (guanine37-N1)-methyltransferase
MSAAGPWTATVLTLFPEMFPGSLGHSLAGKALAAERVRIETIQIRDFATDRHASVDDSPFGGGAGLVMRPDVIDSALRSVVTEGANRPILYLSPRGAPLTQARVIALAEGPGPILLCGRYEGVDQRVLDAWAMEEVSLGDYVLSGGEPAALVLLDACIRLLPGVMGNEDTTAEESFSHGLLEYPHYTRPADWAGREVPPVLLSGNHAEIARWRQAQAETITRARRPDLMRAFEARSVPARK